MLMKSGLGGDHVETMSPLSIDGAKQLEALSEEFQEIATQEVAMSLRRRAVSCSDMGEGKGKGGKGKGGGANAKGKQSAIKNVSELGETQLRKPSKPNVSIEQLNNGTQLGF